MKFCYVVIGVLLVVFVIFVYVEYLICMIVVDVVMGKVVLYEGKCDECVIFVFIFKLVLVVMGFDYGFFKDEYIFVEYFKGGDFDWGGEVWY